MNEKDIVDRVTSLMKMFGDRSRIRKVAIVEDKAAMLPKVFATFFTVNMVNEVLFDLHFKGSSICCFSLVEVKV